MQVYPQISEPTVCMSQSGPWGPLGSLSGASEKGKDFRGGEGAWHPASSCLMDEYHGDLCCQQSIFGPLIL